jgi:monoamine oxidase
MYDCIIIGAGYAGLTTARNLKRAGKNVLLLEARERVGGRIYTKWVDEQTYLDLGGQWLGPTQDAMYALCKEYNISTFPTYDKGKSSLFFNDQLKRYKGLIPPLPLLSLLSLNKGISRITKLSKTINLQQPWLSPGAEEWDRITTAGWMQQTIRNNKARAMFQLAYEAIFACDPARVSFLHSLFYIKSGKNFETLMNIRNGAQQDRISGGAQSICNKMAEELKDELQLNKAVTLIKQSAGGVEVKGNSFTYTAKKIVVAVSPAVANNIVYEQGLPEERTQLMQQQFMGNVVKCYAVYKKPFWRDKKLNGLCAMPGQFISVTFDNSPKDGSKGILMGFSLAEKAKELMQFDEPARKDLVLDCFSKFLGDDAMRCEFYTDHYFTNEPWSKGCYAGLMPPFAITSAGEALRKPCGHIHWAGTETSDVWNGYMEGAVRSGERAAKEILEMINLQS